MRKLGRLGAIVLLSLALLLTFAAAECDGPDNGFGMYSSSR